ncbi:MAG: response regulator [Spirochaetes bacterium]|nr:response regulator [Spirochaetota bacterium]
MGLVDKHPIFLEGLEKVLEATMDIVVVYKATEVFDLFRRISLECLDVFIIDLSVPEAEAIEVILQVRARWPELKILILSSYSEQVYAERMLQSGVAGYLPKTASRRKLVDAIPQIADGRKYLSSSLASKVAASVAAKNQKPHERLSNREFQIMISLARGFTTREIAEQLSLASSTIRTYRRRVLKKTNFRTNLELVRYALREGLVR